MEPLVDRFYGLGFACVRGHHGQGHGDYCAHEEGVEFGVADQVEEPDVESSWGFYECHSRFYVHDEHFVVDPFFLIVCKQEVLTDPVQLIIIGRDDNSNIKVHDEETTSKCYQEECCPDNILVPVFFVARDQIWPLRIHYSVHEDSPIH